MGMSLIMRHCAGEAPCGRQVFMLPKKRAVFLQRETCRFSLNPLEMVFPRRPERRRGSKSSSRRSCRARGRQIKQPAVRGQRRPNFRRIMPRPVRGVGHRKAGVDGPRPQDARGRVANLSVDGDEPKTVNVRRYKREALKKHPDRPGGAVDDFVSLKKATDILLDDRARRDYDNCSDNDDFDKATALIKASARPLRMIFFHPTGELGMEENDDPG